MSKRYSKLIQKLSKYYIFLFLVYELDASDTINIEELLPNIEIVSTFEDRIYENINIQKI